MPRGRQLKRFAPEGVAPDLPPELLPDELYSNVRDVVFRQGAERVRGETGVFGTPTFPPEWLQFTRDAAETPVWLYAAAAGIAYTDGAAHTDITPATFLAPTANNPWSGGVLNNIPVISQRRPWYWPGAGLMLDLPDWPATRFCNAIRPYKFHLIAMGINEAGTLLEDQVLWSDAAAPGQIPQSWTPAPDNEAGSTELSSTGGQCIDGGRLRDSFIIYKDTSTYILDYIGGSQVMAQRLLFEETGIFARNCVAELAAHHVVLTDGDIIRHDGQQVQSIAEDWVRRAIFDRIDGAAARRAFVVSNYAESEVWVCVPETGADYPSVAYVYNKRGRWGVRELPYQPAHIAAGQVRLVAVDNSWDVDPEPWDSDTSFWNEGEGRVDFYELLEASPGQDQLFAIDLEDGREGVPVGAELEKRGISLGDLEGVKTVKAVWLNALGTTGSVLTVELAATDRAGDSPNYNGSARTFVIGQDEKVDVYATGRFFHVRISSDDVNLVRAWRLSSFGLEHEQRGRY